MNKYTERSDLPRILNTFSTHIDWESKGMKPFDLRGWPPFVGMVSSKYAVVVTALRRPQHSRQLRPRLDGNVHIKCAYSGNGPAREFRYNVQVLMVIVNVVRFVSRSKLVAISLWGLWITCVYVVSSLWMIINWQVLL